MKSGGRKPGSKNHSPGGGQKWLIAVLFSGLASTLLFSLPGCGDDGDNPKTVSVSGTVTYKGETLKQGTVMFHPQGTEGGHPATGQIGENGIFTVTTFDNEDGAVVGNHIVTVQIFAEGANPGFEDEAPGAVKIPKRYGDPETSDLLVEVKDGPNTLKLELTDKK